MGIKAMATCVALVALPLAGFSDASLIGMEGVAPAGGITNETNSTQTFDGFDVFVITGRYRDSALVDVDSPSNGSDWLQADNPMGATISRASGEAFSLQSFDATEFDSFFLGGSVITLVGNQQGGGILTASFTTADRSQRDVPYFQTFVLPSNWVNLLNVRIAQADGALALDNVRVNEPFAVPVPEPGTLAIWAFGFVAGCHCWLVRLVQQCSPIGRRVAVFRAA